MWFRSSSLQPFQTWNYRTFVSFSTEKKMKNKTFSSYRLHLVPLKSSINSILFNLVLSTIFSCVRLVRPVRQSIRPVHCVHCARMSSSIRRLSPSFTFISTHIFKAINCALFQLSEFLGSFSFRSKSILYIHIDTTSSGISITCYTRDMRVLLDIWTLLLMMNMFYSGRASARLGPVMKFEMHTWLCLLISYYISYFDYVRHFNWKLISSNRINALFK